MRPQMDDVQAMLGQSPLFAALAPGEAFVETGITALSTGTDLGNFEGRSTEVPGAPDYPRAIGYSNAGVVRLAGPRAGVQPGDRVFSMKPHLSGFIAGTGDLLVSIEVAVPTYLGGDAKAKLEEYAKLANEPNPRTELLAGG